MKLQQIVLTLAARPVYALHVGGGENIMLQPTHDGGLLAFKNTAKPPPPPPHAVDGNDEFEIGPIEPEQSDDVLLQNLRIMPVGKDKYLLSGGMEGAILKVKDENSDSDHEYCLKVFKKGRDYAMQSELSLFEDNQPMMQCPWLRRPIRVVNTEATTCHWNDIMGTHIQTQEHPGDAPSGLLQKARDFVSLQQSYKTKLAAYENYTQIKESFRNPNPSPDEEEDRQKNSQQFQFVKAVHQKYGVNGDPSGLKQSFKKNTMLLFDWMECDLFDHTWDTVKGGRRMPGVPAKTWINGMKQILLGLLATHSSNICHGDLKMENVFVDKNDDFFIGDFGGAEEMHEDFGGLGNLKSKSKFRSYLGRGGVRETKIVVQIAI